jgi:hypothetical protein
MIPPTLDYKAIAAMRTALGQRAYWLESAACQSAGTNATHMQSVACACEAAAVALFECMNKAASYLGDPDAEAVIETWFSR